MGKEIERKFLVRSKDFLVSAEDRIEITQGYLTIAPKGYTLRLRITGEIARLTIKKDAEEGKFTRNEWEYEIPLSDAIQMMPSSSGQIIRKVRHIVPYKGHRWEVDIFKDSLDGLIVAEIELQSEDESFEAPPWIGKEVTNDPDYYNSSLATRGLPKNLF